ncbi:MAG: bifunctional adenosylcobinamide kinase/adenosylcobinamide-phosphate guanylyltransferase [Dehalococcoidia bacterium]|nr:bifunctional adenosylcobinamide kinase/adenosylcobinamide-phosphate guanylyltransferase [Dehalococcoidia bacterium]
MSLTLVLGGVRSGKSAFAERLASPPVVYVATASWRDDDPEWQARIDRHRARRPSDWRTLEAATAIARRVQAECPDAKTVLVDSFGLVVAAALGAADPSRAVADEIAGIVADAEHRHWIIVSEEVGLAPVATTPIGRQFQDLQGEANARIAAAASRCVLVVAGRPVELPLT